MGRRMLSLALASPSSPRIDTAAAVDASASTKKNRGRLPLNRRPPGGLALVRPLLLFSISGFMRASGDAKRQTQWRLFSFLRSETQSYEDRGRFCSWLIPRLLMILLLLLLPLAAIACTRDRSWVLHRQPFCDACWAKWLLLLLRAKGEKEQRSVWEDPARRPHPITAALARHRTALFIPRHKTKQLTNTYGVVVNQRSITTTMRAAAATTVMIRWERRLMALSHPSPRGPLPRLLVRTEAKRTQRTKKEPVPVNIQWASRYRRLFRSDPKTPASTQPVNPHQLARTSAQE